MDTPLPDEIVRLFLHGLVEVCRADGIINADEVEKMRQLARRFGVAQLDEEELITADGLPPDALADSLSRAVESADPYRTAPMPSLLALKEIFLGAALEVATADLHLHPEEVWLLREYTRAFQLPPTIGTLDLVDE